MRQIALAAHETITHSDVAGGMGVLRITSPAALHVTATSRCASCRAAISLPLLAQPVDEGELAAAVPANQLGWESKVFIANAYDVAATVTLAMPDG